MGVLYENGTGSGNSPAIWDRFPSYENMINPGVAYRHRDDFLNAPLFASATSQSGYITFQDSSATVQGLSTEVGGVLRLTPAGAQANDAAGLTTSGNLAGFAKFSSSAPKDLFFEARIRPGLITSGSLFIGLASEGLAINDALADSTGALKTDKAFVGFRTLAATPTKLDAVYQAASQTLSTSAGVTTLVVSTWYKVGLRYDAARQTLEFLVNGVVVRKIVAADLAAATFPDNVILAPLIYTKNSTTAATILDLDWWDVAQIRA